MSENIHKLPTPDRPPTDFEPPTARDCWHAIFRLKRVVRHQELMLVDLARMARRSRLALASLVGAFDGARRAQVEATLEEIEAARGKVLTARTSALDAIAEVAISIARTTTDPHELATLLGTDHRLIPDPLEGRTLIFLSLITPGLQKEAGVPSVWTARTERILHDALFRRFLHDITTDPGLRRQGVELAREHFRTRFSTRCH